MYQIYQHNQVTKKLQLVAEQETSTLQIQPGQLIYLNQPDLDLLHDVLHDQELPDSYFRYMLDTEESARVERDQKTGNTLLVYAVSELNEQPEEHHMTQFSTLPISVLLTEQNVILIDHSAHDTLPRFLKESEIDLNQPTLFILQMAYYFSTRYIKDIRHLNHIRELVEDVLKKDLKNTHLYSLLEIEKSFVYFSMALKANMIVLEKVARTNVLETQAADLDLLDDVAIELRQANDMTEISRQLLSETLTTYSSIISNEVNDVMKFLTTYSIILTVPTMIFSFYGMNVKLPFDNLNLGWFPIFLVSLVATIMMGYRFWRQKFF